MLPSRQPVSESAARCFEPMSKPEIRIIEGDFTSRVETGPVQFGDDWPGTFIRGDNAAYYAMQLKQLIDAVEKGEVNEYHKFAAMALRGLVSDLGASNLNDECRAMLEG